MLYYDVSLGKTAIGLAILNILGRSIGPYGAKGVLLTTLDPPVTVVLNKTPKSPTGTLEPDVGPEVNSAPFPLKKLTGRNLFIRRGLGLIICSI